MTQLAFIAGVVGDSVPPYSLSPKRLCPPHVANCVEVLSDSALF